MQLAHFFDRILPSEVIPLLDAYFADEPEECADDAGAGGGGGGELSRGVERDCDADGGVAAGAGAAGGLLEVLAAAAARVLLVPLSLVPLTVASVLVVFGQLA